MKKLEFRSFFLGGFECSTHCRTDGKRLDLIAATCHNRFAEQDYRRLLSAGLATCRDGLRWHLIEQQPGRFDFSCDLPMIRAARRTGIQVIWDLLHYGWPEGLDVFSEEFVERFGAFCESAARTVARETEGQPWFTVVNEPSFLSWAGGDQGFFPPFARGRGNEFKRQLVRATIAGIDAVRSVVPHARFLQVDPLIHIVTEASATAEDIGAAEAHCRAQFDAWDMLAGRLSPELGGHPRYLDVIGCNYYVHNQWVHGGRFIERTDPRYKPLHRLLQEVHNRYGRPVLLAETGIEDDRRAEWLRWVTDEVVEAMRLGVPMQGICLYPIVNHPGWDDNRHCHNGLWDYCNEDGEREIYRPLEQELLRQQGRVEQCLKRQSKQLHAEEVCA